MGLVVSFADARAERVRAKLCGFADSRSPGMVETHRGLIAARRIFCREAVAVLIDRQGIQTRLAYDEITDVSSVLPAADIVRLADWQVVDAGEIAVTASLLSFPAPPAHARECGNSAS